MGKSTDFEHCPNEFLVEIDDDLKRQLWCYCQWRGSTRVAVVRKAIKKFIDRELSHADAESKREYEEFMRGTHSEPLKLVMPEKTESRKTKRSGSKKDKGSK